MAKDDADEGSPAREYRRKGALPGQSKQEAYIPDDATRANVELYAMWGLSNPQIAGIIDVGEGTLKNHYQAELTKGRGKGPKIAAGKLFQKVLDGNLTAIIFYLKAKGGFQERQLHQMADADGEPIDLSHIRIDNLDDATIRAAIGFIQDALAAAGRGPAGQAAGGTGQEGTPSDREAGGRYPGTLQ